jgi:endonuclease YncB( thermonuclease family)
MAHRTHTLLLSAALLLVGATAPLHAQDGGPQVGDVVAGDFRPSDGDSFRVDGVRIRLLGVDAPESDQTCKMGGVMVECGAMARDALADFVEGEPVSCEIVDIDRFDRRVAVCSSVSGVLNSLMAQSGWVVPMERFSTLFVADAIAAQQAGRGLWSMEFHDPADWRRGARW